MPENESLPESPEDQDLDLIFGALSDSSRRKVLQLLRQAGELRVTDVAAAFDMSLNGVSKHLKILEKAGLIRREIRGREHWLRPHPERLSPALRYFDLVEHFWHGRLAALARALENNPNQPQRNKDPNHDR